MPFHLETRSERHREFAPYANESCRDDHATGSRRFSSASNDEPTIFAVSTAPGRAAIAIVRCSGPAVIDIYKALCPLKPLPKPRFATLRTLYRPSPSPSHVCSPPPEVLDPGALILYFPAPNTVTGEPLVELHLHGGPATVRAVLAAISSLSIISSPIRYAEPGEFTRRAFYNNRLDLTQIEALGDTLAAETEQQRRLAVRGSTSTLTERYEAWRYELLQARGELEALIDFQEDQHFDESPAELAGNVAKGVARLTSQIDTSIRNAARGELLRNGIKVALLGAPNAGKSSLLNKIVGREVAIVSSQAGTTRDVVETNVDIGGFFCNFGDLAGLRGGEMAAKGRQPGEEDIGEIEAEGIRRAKKRAIEADVVIVVLAVEPGKQGKMEVTIPEGVTNTIRNLDLARQRVVFAINKIDLLEDLSPNFGNVEGFAKSINPTANVVFPLTCKPGVSLSVGNDGVQGLLEGLTESFHSLTDAAPIPGVNQISSGRDEASLGASERQARLLGECKGHLDTFIASVAVPDDDENLDQDIDIVLAAESLRDAAECLAKITGRGEGGDVEEVLGVVFENFCVGK